MTSARETIFANLRRSLKVADNDDARIKAVASRLKKPPAGVIPDRAKLSPEKQVTLFCEMATAVQTTVDRVAAGDDVPAAIAQYLREHNLPQALRRGDDPRLASLPWERQKTLEVTTGPSSGDDLVGLAHATAGVAETGTLILQSGPDNPSTLNFLPETHIVVVEAGDIVGDYETVWKQLRKQAGHGQLPRTINMITGPSRSGDIEQTILLGAHGPKQLHIIVVGGRNKND